MYIMGECWSFGDIRKIKVALNKEFIAIDASNNLDLRIDGLSDNVRHWLTGDHYGNHADVLPENLQFSAMLIHYHVICSILPTVNNW